MRLGGHFPGSCVLHWERSPANGKPVVFAGWWLPGGAWAALLAHSVQPRVHMAGRSAAQYLCTGVGCPAPEPQPTRADPSWPVPPALPPSCRRHCAAVHGPRLGEAPPPARAAVRCNHPCRMHRAHRAAPGPARSARTRSQRASTLEPRPSSCSRSHSCTPSQTLCPCLPGRCGAWPPPLAAGPSTACGAPSLVHVSLLVQGLGSAELGCALLVSAVGMVLGKADTGQCLPPRNRSALCQAAH